MSETITRRDCLVYTGALTSTLALSLNPGSAAGEPKQAGDGNLRFLCVGDWGMRGSGPQMKVAAAMGEAVAAQPINFVISLGDNFYRDGVESVTDPHWQASFEQVYTAPGLQCPWYPVLGNHDQAMAQVAYSQTSSRWRMPGAFYLHSERLADGTKVDFIFLDTEVIVKQHSGIHEFVGGDDADDQVAWLDHALQASSARWKIVVGHHPVFSGGPHGNTRELIAIVKPLLDRHGVAAYLSGHDHNMQHLAVDNVQYLTCGTGATLRPSTRVAETIFEAQSLGFLQAVISRANGIRLHRFRGKPVAFDFRLGFGLMAFGYGSSRDSH